MLTTFMDFCAGIGAGRLGLEQNGLTCIGYSEINNLSIKTYNTLHNSSKEKNFGDLTKINCAELPNFDLLIAGFPCQTFSVIGQRKGFEDDRGRIIYYLIKILKERNVPYFLLENVKGLVNHDNGKTIAKIIEMLNDAGFYVGYKVLNSLDYGVPQMRERVYFIGIRKDMARKNLKFEWPLPVKRPSLKEYLVDSQNEISKSTFETFKTYLNNKYNINKYSLEELLEEDGSVLDTRQSDLRVYKDKVPTLRTGRQGLLYVKNGKLHTLTGFESLLLQGFSVEYANRVRNIIPNSHLLAQAGNAMSVPVINLLCKSLINYIEG